MGFRKLKSVRLPERKQGFIYFTCLNYRELPRRQQDKIRRLCDRAGGQYADALFDALTHNDRTMDAVARQHYVSETVLYAARKRFYELWDKE